MNCSLRSILVACFLSDSSCHHRAPCVGYLTRLIGPTMRCNKPTALALLLLLLLLLLRLSGRGSRTTVAVSPLHVTPRRTLPRSFRLSTPIDVSAATDAASLRRVARARAVDRGRGPELMLLATDAGGGALALNALLNLHALDYSDSVLVVAYVAEACPLLGGAAGQLTSESARNALGATPCVHDGWWEDHLTRADERRIRIDEMGPGRWLIRWAAMARLTRLGYNVLCVDTDAVLLDDVYRHLHSDALCGRFALMFGSENPGGGLQNGVAYSCGAARDGGSAWVLQEVVDRYLRLADACGGVNGTDEESNALCPVGSWLRAARLFPGFAFDQRAQIGAVHAAITGSGHHWWVQIGMPRMALKPILDQQMRQLLLLLTLASALRRNSRHGRSVLAIRLDEWRAVAGAAQDSRRDAGRPADNQGGEGTAAQKAHLQQA